MKNYSDIEVIRGLEKSDPNIISYIWSEFNGKLYYFALQLIKNPQDAEDVVATVFERIQKKAYDFESMPKSHIQSFLYTAVRNQCIDYFRSKAREAKGVENFRTSLNTLENSVTIEHLVIQTDLLNKLYCEIKNLPKGQREVFKLTYIEGLDVREISKKLGISVSTVTTQRQRALEYLKFFKK